MAFFYFIPVIILSLTLTANASIDDILIQAQGYERAGNIRGAIHLLEQAVRQNPTVEMRNHLGLLYAKSGVFGNAEHQFKQTLIQDSRNLFARLWLGVVYLSQNDLARAFDAFHTLSQTRPETEEQRYFLANAYYFLGAIYSFRRENEHALKALEAARQSNPRDDETHYRLGALYQRLGKKNLAIQEYQAALALNSHHVKSRNALGWIAYNNGQRDQARQLWQQTLSYSPKNQEARDSLAKSYNDEALIVLQAGQHQKARQLWKRAQNYDSNNKAAKFYLARYR